MKMDDLPKKSLGVHCKSAAYGSFLEQCNPNQTILGISVDFQIKTQPRLTQMVLK